MKVWRFHYAAFVSVALCGLAVTPFVQSALAGAQTKGRQSAGRYVVRKIIDLGAPVVQLNTSGQLERASSRLELATDVRVRPGMSDAQTTDFLPAKIRLVDTDGKVVQEKTLERSRATLETAPPLYGAKTVRPMYLLTVDYSADMGSYNGPITFLLEVSRGKMVFASVNNKPIGLMRSLKTDWKFAPSKSAAGKTTDILEVACRPNTAQKLSDDNTDNDFVVVYRRFHFNGRGWTKREKSRLGFWEDDGKFPPVSLFPAPVL